MEATLSAHSQLLRVNTNKGVIFICPSRILFLRGNHKHTFLCGIHGEKTETHHMVKWYEEQLSVLDFCRCHDSYMVNLAYVECLAGNNFRLCNDSFVPISKRRKRHSLECFKQFVLKSSMTA